MIVIYVCFVLFVFGGCLGCCRGTDAAVLIYSRLALRVFFFFFCSLFFIFTLHFVMFYYLATPQLAQGRCTHAIHGRSQMTIDPPIPTMPGRSTSGFHRPGGGGSSACRK